MTISILRLLCAAAASAAVLCFAILPSRAGQVGDDKWCAVTNQGGDAMLWDCEFDTVEDCSPAVSSGSPGFCALNPTYQPPPLQPPPSTDPQPLMLQPSPRT